MSTVSEVWWLQEEEMYSTPLDDIDEYTSFADALHQACEDQPELLVAVGLTSQPNASPLLTEQEVAALNSAVRTGIERKANADKSEAGSDNTPARNGLL
ncbi:MAG: hypothetical protein SGPRY_009543 [Prymnesium sp.]